MLRKNIVSLIVAVIICYLSLSDAEGYSKISLLSFPGSDYLVHFLMYFGFMSVIVIEHRKEILNIKILLLVSLIPLFYGILMELLQLWLTSTRYASVIDVLFNFAGIVMAALSLLFIRSLCVKPSK